MTQQHHHSASGKERGPLYTLPAAVSAHCVEDGGGISEVLDDVLLNGRALLHVLQYALESVHTQHTHTLTLQTSTSTLTLYNHCTSYIQLIDYMPSHTRAVLLYAAIHTLL